MFNAMRICIRHLFTANRQKRVCPVFFVEIGCTEDSVLFREPNFSFLPDLSQVQKVPRVISILVEVFPFFYI